MKMEDVRKIEKEIETMKYEVAEQKQHIKENQHKLFGSRDDILQIYTNALSHAVTKNCLKLHEDFLRTARKYLCSESYRRSQ